MIMSYFKPGPTPKRKRASRLTLPAQLDLKVCIHPGSKEASGEVQKKT